jgi:hypothetical protein
MNDDIHIRQFIALTTKAVIDTQAKRRRPIPGREFMRFCPQCREMTMHESLPNGYRCIFHYSHPSPSSERGG